MYIIATTSQCWSEINRDVPCQAQCPSLPRYTSDASGKWLRGSCLLRSVLGSKETESDKTRPQPQGTMFKMSLDLCSTDLPLMVTSKIFLERNYSTYQGTSRPSSFQLSHCATWLRHITLPRPLNLSASISSPTTGGYIITVSFQRGFWEDQMTQWDKHLWKRLPTTHHSPCFPLAITTQTPAKHTLPSQRLEGPAFIAADVAKWPLLANARQREMISATLRACL